MNCSQYFKIREGCLLDQYIREFIDLSPHKFCADPLPELVKKDGKTMIVFVAWILQSMSTSDLAWAEDDKIDADPELITPSESK